MYLGERRDICSVLKEPAGKPGKQWSVVAGILGSGDWDISRSILVLMSFDQRRERRIKESALSCLANYRSIRNINDEKASS